MKNNELINIGINEEGNQVVSARELHGFLGIDTRFNDWMSRMFEYGFEEGLDYVEFYSNLSKTYSRYQEGIFSINSPKNPKGGRPSKDFALTLDTAKEIAMIQRSDKGREVRRYFIECERKLRQNPPIAYLIDRIQGERKELEAKKADIEQKLEQLDMAVQHIGILEPQESWEQRFKRRYSESVLYFIEKYIEEWISRERIPNYEFRELYQSYGFNREVFKPLREYCRRHDIHVKVSHSVRYKGKLKPGRAHIFRNQTP